MRYSRRTQVMTLISIAMLIALARFSTGQSPPQTTEPARIVIVMPDFHRLPRDKWMGQREEVKLQLMEIARQTMKLASDERLDIEERRFAVSIMRWLGPDVATEALLTNVELRDERGFGFDQLHLMEYPVVTILQEYGSAVRPTVMLELLKPQSSVRRKLMCDVLEKVLGRQDAIQEVRKWRANEIRKDTERKNLDDAIAELESRSNPAK